MMTNMPFPAMEQLPDMSFANGTEGDIQDRFTLCKQLHTTLYGETTLCQDEAQQQKLVVLKRISLSALRANSEHARENPRQERDVIAMLAKTGGHDNIVQYDGAHDAMFYHDDNLFIVMEYCAGGDLYDFVSKKPDARLHEIDALRVFAQIARGVQFLHDHGIAHRDLSLENVLLQSGTAKICDFGLSTDANTLCDGDIVGKLYYMAPEVVHAETYDPKAADIWSLGILLFILLTGSPLIAEEAPREATFRLLAKCGIVKILEMWDLAKLVTPETVALLSAMLQVDPKARVTIAELLRQPALKLFAGAASNAL
ncbi:Camk/camkl protein kinase, partial [Globisporangium splendens]